MANQPDRIPIARSVVYAVRGMPEIADEYNATRTIAPTEINLTYRASEDSQLGRVHAYVSGWWMENGARVPMDKPVGRHFWDGKADDWPEWLAEEARLHDPAVLPAPVDRAAVLREAADRIDATDLPQDYVDMFDNGARWATTVLRRVAAETRTPHACGNCDGIDPDSCLTNPDRTPPAAGAQQPKETRP